MRNEILQTVFSIDEKTIQGIAGLILSIGMPLLNSVNDVVQVIGATGGLVLLWLAIRYKYLQIQELKSKLKKDEEAD